jgi:hypothetical protein
VAGENRKTVKEEAEEVKYTNTLSNKFRSAPLFTVPCYQNKREKKTPPTKKRTHRQTRTLQLQCKNIQKSAFSFPFFHHDIIATLTRKKKKKENGRCSSEQK